MKRSLLFTAIAIGAFYLIKQFLQNDEDEITVATPRRKHLTNAFSKAKEHAILASE